MIAVFRRFSHRHELTEENLSLLIFSICVATIMVVLAVVAASNSGDDVSLDPCRRICGSRAVDVDLFSVTAGRLGENHLPNPLMRQFDGSVSFRIAASFSVGEEVRS